MCDFDYINTFFNILYNNETVYIRDLLKSYDYMRGFCQWLEIRHIHISSLTSLSEHDMSFVSACKTLQDIDHILHIELKSEIEHLIELYRDKTHILYIPGFNHEEMDEIPFQEYQGYYFYKIQNQFSKNDLSFFDPFPAFVYALNHVDQWPGFLVFNAQQFIFLPSYHLSEIIECIQHQQSLFDYQQVNNDDSYFLQLSDLHLGKERSQKGLYQLKSSLDNLVPLLRSQYPLKVLITGDLMESPNRKNMYLANDFMNDLKKCYKANVTFILGNHDVIVHGFNVARNQKSKVIAYLLGENIKVIEKEKIIIIKMDTTSEGNLARGMVGKRQLREIDDELSAIEHIEDYTLLVMLHHHVYPISKAQFLKTKWHEKTFINRIIETSKVLVDASLLIDWLNKRNICYIFHGHKHLPFFRKEKQQYYIGAGSATGGLKESRSRYISYNLLKYSLSEKKMKVCMIFYDDKSKLERQRVEVYLFEEEE